MPFRHVACYNRARSSPSLSRPLVPDGAEFDLRKIGMAGNENVAENVAEKGAENIADVVMKLCQPHARANPTCCT